MRFEPICREREQVPSYCWATPSCAFLFIFLFFDYVAGCFLRYICSNLNSCWLALVTLNSTAKQGRHLLLYKRMEFFKDEQTEVRPSDNYRNSFSRVCIYRSPTFNFSNKLFSKLRVLDITPSPIFLCFCTALYRKDGKGRQIIDWAFIVALYHTRET